MKVIEDRVTEIETKLAFQENMIEELNKVIITQGELIAALEQKLARLNDTMKNMGDPRVADKDDVPPPHY